MKRLLRMFDLSKNEQRVVLIVTFILVAIAFIGYERRVSHVHIHAPGVPEMKASPSPEQTEKGHG
jgi:hypothetical protein